MKNSITITIPYPPKELNPNGRPHHMAKAVAVKKYRARSQVEALAAMGGKPAPRWLYATIRIDQYHKTANFMDRQNIISAHKASVDGLIDAGVLGDDREVTFAPVGRFKDKDDPRTVITITPTEDATE